MWVDDNQVHGRVWSTKVFDVTVTQIAKHGGAVVWSEDYTTHYQPEDQVTCTNPNHKN